MKRVGERGEGRFERISWDEALKTVADKLRETVEKYGNESLYWQYCSGQQSLVNSRRAWWRLLNLCGGYLKLLRFLFDCSDLGRLPDDLRREPVL